ncbi:50S ribosomal protein L29 [Patescibacteria group bacterium]
MKKKEKESLRSLSVDEMRKQMQEMYQKLASLRSSRYTKPSKNVREQKDIKKRIAVIQTVIKETQLYETKNN